MSLTTDQTRRDTKPAALHLTRNYDWRDDGTCRQTDPELHFPVAHTQGWKKQTRQAKQVCAGCPVIEECLKWALETGQTAGVWGGLSEQERRQMLRVAKSQTERCWDRQEWIEEQLEKGASQRDIARQLGVTRSVVCKVIPQFEAERAYVEGVKAA